MVVLVESVRIAWGSRFVLLVAAVCAVTGAAFAHAAWMPFWAQHANLMETYALQLVICGLAMFAMALAVDGVWRVAIDVLLALSVGGFVLAIGVSQTMGWGGASAKAGGGKAAAVAVGMVAQHEWSEGESASISCESAQ